MEPPQEVVDYFRTCLEKRVELEHKKLQDIDDAIVLWEKNTEDLSGDNTYIDDAYEAGLNSLHRKCKYGVVDASMITDEYIRIFIRRIQNELGSLVIHKY